MSDEGSVGRPLSADAMELLRRMGVDSQLAPPASPPPIASEIEIEPFAKAESAAPVESATDEPESTAGEPGSGAAESDTAEAPEAGDAEPEEAFQPSALDRWAEIRAQLHVDAALADTLAPATPQLELVSEPVLPPEPPEVEPQPAAEAAPEPALSPDPEDEPAPLDAEFEAEPEPVSASTEEPIETEASESEAASVELAEALAEAASVEPEPTVAEPDVVEPAAAEPTEPDPVPAEPVRIEPPPVEVVADVFPQSDDDHAAVPEEERMVEPAAPEASASEVLSEAEDAEAVEQTVAAEDLDLTRDEEPDNPVGAQEEMPQPSLKATGNVKLETIDGARAGAKFLGKSVLLGAAGARCLMDRFDLPVGTRVKLSLIAPRFVDQIDVPDAIVLDTEPVQGKLQVQLAFGERHDEVEAFVVRHFVDKPSGGFFSRFRR